MNVWRPVDAQGDWIRRAFTPEVQIRVGVLMTDLGAVFCALVFRTQEPPLIFEMSALALFFAGIGTVLAKVTEEQT